MNGDKIMEAIGMIDDEIIAEAKKPVKKRFGAKKVLALVAALIIIFAFAVTSNAVKPFIRNLFKDTKQFVEMLKPVNVSCISEGIEMKVISANVAGSEAYIYISMQDLEGNRIDDSFDLYDSYSISRSFDGYGTCEKVDFDKETGIITFLVTVGSNNGKNIKNGKITFSVKESLGGKITFNSYIDEIDLKKFVLSSETKQITSRRGAGYDGTEEMKKFVDNLESLVPKGKLASPFPGVTITAIGYVDGKLHIQLLYENIGETDCHGSVRLVNKEGKKIRSFCSVSFWDENGNAEIQKNLFGKEYIQYFDSYDEQVFEISPEELKNCRLFGEFSSHTEYIEGNWSVTFDIKNIY